MMLHQQIQRLRIPTGQDVCISWLLSIFIVYYTYGVIKIMITLVIKADLLIPSYRYVQFIVYYLMCIYTVRVQC